MSKVLRELHRGELTTKDMSVLREGETAKEQVKKNYGHLKEYSLNHTVSMSWQENNPDRDLRPFTLYIDDKRYTLSWGELRDMDREGFFRRDKGNPKSYTLRWLGGPAVTLDTDLNDEAQRDMIVRLTTKDAECYLDWYEVLRYGRFV